MTVSTILQVVWAFALIALLLVLLTWGARAVQRTRLVHGSRRRLVTTVESTPLAQNVGVHVVKVGDRYYLLGGGSGGVALLAELERDEVEPYIAVQRQALEQQRELLWRVFTRFRRS